jgi:hypothetical protein
LIAISALLLLYHTQAITIKFKNTPKVHNNEVLHPGSCSLLLEYKNNIANFIYCFIFICSSIVPHAQCRRSTGLMTVVFVVAAAAIATVLFCFASLYSPSANQTDQTY